MGIASDYAKTKLAQASTSRKSYVDFNADLDSALGKYKNNLLSEMTQAKRKVPQDLDAIKSLQAKVDSIPAMRQSIVEANKSMISNGKSPSEVQSTMLQALNGGDSSAYGDLAETFQTISEGQTQSKLATAQEPYTAQKPEPKPGKPKQESSAQESGTQEPETQESGTQEPETKQKQDNGMRLSASFYRDLGAHFQGKPVGNTYDAMAGTAHEMADADRLAGAHRQMEAQKEAQEGNRNIYSEASKRSSFKNDLQNKEAVQNSNQLGKGVALLRSNNVEDPSQDRQYTAERRDKAAELRQKSDMENKYAVTDEGDSEQFKIGSRDFDNNINESDRLSKGEGTPNEQPETPEPETPEQPETPEPDNTKMPAGTPQHVINALFGSSKGEDLRNGSSQEDQQLYNWALSQGIKPAPLNTYWEQSGHDPNKYEQLYINDPNTGDAATKQRVVQMLRQGRVGEGGDASRNFNLNEMDQMHKNMSVDAQGNIGYAEGTDYATPGYHLVGEEGPELVKFNGGEQVLPNDETQLLISDYRMKYIRDALDMGVDLDDPWYEYLLQQHGGKLLKDGRDYDLFNDEDDYDESVLQDYADNIRNYVYEYKPEAAQIDPRIDPSEEHIGPMAQDIEKVNPACVKETPEGVKTVDTSRLAMMNAGAIADLAREMAELKSMFQEILNGK